MRRVLTLGLDGWLMSSLAASLLLLLSLLLRYCYHT